MMTSDAKRALAKPIRVLREEIILPDLREATERAYLGGPARGTWPRRVGVSASGAGARGRDRRHRLRATASSRRWRTHIVSGGRSHPVTRARLRRRCQDLHRPTRRQCARAASADLVLVDEHGGQLRHEPEDRSVR
jgi:hypothetical protein